MNNNIKNGLILSLAVVGGIIIGRSTDTSDGGKISYTGWATGAAITLVAFLILDNVN